MTAMTTIKVPVALRDEVRQQAQRFGVSQAEYLAKVVADAKQATFLRAAARQRPDADYLAEFRTWDNADLGSIGS